MSDDNDDAEAKAKAAHAERLAEIKEAERKHLAAIDEKFADHKAELKRELAELGAADASEKAELRRKLEELEEWKEQAIEDAKARGKEETDKSTMVVPPGEIPEQHPRKDDVASPVEPGQEHATAGGKKGWKRIW